MLLLLLLLLLLAIPTCVHTKCQPPRVGCTVAFIHLFTDAVLKCKVVGMIFRVPIPVHGKNCRTDVVTNRSALICLQSLDILDKLHPRFSSIVSLSVLLQVLGCVAFPHTRYCELTRFDHTYASVPRSNIRGNCGEEIDTETVHVNVKSCQFGSVMPAGMSATKFEVCSVRPRPLPPNFWRAFDGIYINLIANANARV